MSRKLTIALPALLLVAVAGGCGEEECNYTCWDQSVPLENGGSQMCGGCVCGGPPDCVITEGSRSYTCETARWLEPGEHESIRGWGVGQNSFWYDDPITADSPDELDPCTDEEPCCHDIAYPVGFRVGTVVVPLDTSEVEDHDWGCLGTNCEVACTPSLGTRIKVHVTIVPHINDSMDITHPDEATRYRVLEVCDIVGTGFP